MRSYSAMRARLVGWLERGIRSEYLVAVAILGLLVVLFFAPIFVSGKTFSTVADNQGAWYPWTTSPRHALSATTQSDQATVYYPWEVFTEYSLEHEGQVPLWDPLSFGGHPLHANSQTGLAYPPRLLLAWLTSPSVTHDVYVMAHVFGAGMAMFALMKQFGSRLAGAALASVAWAFSSYTMVWVQLESFGAPAIFLPLALLCVRRWYDRESWPDLLLGGLALGALFIGGSGELSLLTYLCVGGYCSVLALRRLIAQWHRLRARPRAALLSAPAVVVLAGLAVASVTLLPFLDALDRSQREPARYRDLVDYSGVEPASFAHAVWPSDLPLTDVGMLEEQAFVGTLTAAFALVGLLRRRPGTGLARTLMVVVFLFAIGTPLTWVGHHLVPGLDRLLFYGRTLFLWSLGLAILGGVGLDAVLEWLRRDGDHRLPLARLVPVAGAVVVALTAAQLLYYGREANVPFQRRAPADLYPATPAVDALAPEHLGRAGGGRVVAVTNNPTPGQAYLFGWTMPGATGMALGVRSAGGYESLLPERSEDLWRVVAGGAIEPERPEGDDPSLVPLRVPLPAFAQYFRDDVRYDLLGRMGVTAVLTPPDIGSAPGWDATSVAERGLRPRFAAADGVVFDVVDALPRAFLVDDVDRVRSGRAALEHLIAPDFDPRREVILEVDGGDGEGERTGPERETPTTAARIEWEVDRPNDLRLRVDSDRAGWLVLLDSYDPGWSATVDGRTVDVEQANFNFRAIRVPAGTSTVSFTYRPPGLVLGAWLSVLSTLTIVGLAIVAAVRRRRRGAPMPAPSA